jgi:hypothetical protein
VLTAEDMVSPVPNGEARPKARQESNMSRRGPEINLPAGAPATQETAALEDPLSRLLLIGH